MKWFCLILVLVSLTACKPAPLEDEFTNPLDPNEKVLNFDQEQVINLDNNSNLQFTVQDYSFVVNDRGTQDFQICLSDAFANCDEQFVNYIILEDNTYVRRFFSGEYSSATHCSSLLRPGRHRLRIELNNMSCGAAFGKMFSFTPSYK